MTEIHIHLKKQHLVIFISLIAIFGVVLVTNALDTTRPYHAVGQVDFSEGSANADLDLDGNSLVNYGNSFGVPSGAVMAFNLASCPDGWSELTNTQGRVIVGLNSGDSDFDSLGKTGGEKEHQLTVAEMPSHRHDYTRMEPDRGGVGIDGDWGNLEYPTYPTSSKGGDQPHNNLQPYITFLYCQKD